MIRSSILVVIAWFMAAFGIAWVSVRFLKATPGKIAAAYATVILLLALAAVLRTTILGIPVRGETWDPYVVACGPAVWFVSLMLLMFIPLEKGLVMLVFLPAAFYLLLGVPQWYGLACLARRAGTVEKRDNRNPRDGHETREAADGK